VLKYECSEPLLNGFDCAKKTSIIQHFNTSAHFIFYILSNLLVTSYAHF
jgi:hypothetical protein